MDGIGAEVSQKIRSAIKAKLTEIGVYVDEELPDYVMVMVANKRSKEQMDDDLKLFLGKHTSLFTTWLHHVLQKLQEVTVANLAGVKRKILSDDTKKKKKTKSDGEKKEPKKKIKTEPVEDLEQDMAKSARASSKERTDSHNFVNESCDTSSSKSHNEAVAEQKRKEKKDGKSTERPVKERKISSSSSKSYKQHEEPSNTAEDLENINKTTAIKSQSVPSEADDLDDEDCINIRTDGELLDTAEEAIGEEPSKQSTENDSQTISKNNRKADKKQTESHKNIIVSKEKTIHNKKQKSPSPTPPVKSGKVIDARELLNRKKAAKQVAESESRSRKRSVDRRSESPVRKRRSDARDKGHHEDRDQSKRSGQEIDKESYNHKNSSDSDKDRKGERIRDSYLTKRKDNRSWRTNSRDIRNESDVRKTARNNNDDWNLSRLSRAARMSENRKAHREVDSSGGRRDSEEPRKRGGVLSQVVLRSPEPEENVETPVPSVVKVTPRPRRPPSQQPSSTLIMKAISEANRSLANVPPRPDSTQLTRKKPVLTRTLRQLEKIAPENIAISITNPLALQNVGNNLKSQERKEGPGSPKDDKSSDKLSPKHHTIEDNTSEPDDVVLNDTPPVDEELKNKEPENIEEDSQQQEEIQKPVLELEAPSNLEPNDEPMEEMSDPQFVVTLNGYDPDGLYSQSEIDLGEVVDEEEWLKDADDDPMLTSTPDMTASPRPMKDRLGSPIIHTNKPAVNHSNLIAVEIMKSKTMERCKYWPACRLADKCTFYHPTKPCKAFPACKFGNSCLYIHPQCKYNLLCTRKDCVFSHTTVHTPLQPQAVPKVKALYAASAPSFCKFYPNCANANCQFAHTLRACRYGLYCTKKDCSFDHGKVAPVDKLKWTRGSTTT